MPRSKVERNCRKLLNLLKSQVIANPIDWFS
jgi:hypothetical protein